MKWYIKQFYNEGLATTFYLKPINFISRYVKNEKLLGVLKVLIAILYTIFVLVLAWFMFWDRYPL